MDAVAAGAHLVHLLHVDSRVQPVGVTDVGVAHEVVVQHGAPEGPHLVDVQRVEGELPRPGVVGIRADLERLRGRGDLPGQREVQVGERPALLGDQADLQNTCTQVEIRMVTGRLGESSDLRDQLRPVAKSPVRKTAKATDHRTRQSSTPSASWNCRGVIASAMDSP